MSLLAFVHKSLSNLYFLWSGPNFAHFFLESDLISYGLGTTPLKKNLFDAAGARHSETLRAFEFGFGLHWFGSAAQRE